ILFSVSIYLSGIPGSYNNPVFNSLRNHQNVSHNDSIILYSQEQYTRIPNSHPHHHLLSAFLPIAILIDVKWYLTVILICFFLMTTNYLICNYNLL
uniref:Uncharacterized protein n=1 Tax=Canis lupus familiaris TaxID=9615 RepID=A0A8C0M0H0_CANLF